jgi:para-aminobenzoate synthetase
VCLLNFYSLAALCRLAIPNACVHIIKNDSVSFDEIRPFLACFSAVIVGPGPGSPLVDKDVGVIKSLFHLPDSETLPIFGVCLGLQSMAVEHGAAIHRLHVVKHGQISPLMHSGQDLFLNIDDIQVTRYHSLHVRFEGIDNLQELAHVDDGSENGRVIMAIRHKTNPFWVRPFWNINTYN